MPNFPITLRPATEADHATLHALDDRLIAEASLPGATREDFQRFQRRFTDATLADNDPKSRLIVAEGERSDILSYMHVKPTHDEVLDCETGYLSIIAVAEAARGGGRLALAARTVRPRVLRSDAQFPRAAFRIRGREMHP